MSWYIVNKGYVYEARTERPEGKVIELPDHMYHAGFSKWDLEDLWLKHHKVFIYRMYKGEELAQWVGVKACKDYLLDSFPNLTWEQIIDAMKAGKVETEHAFYYVKPF